MTEYREDYIPGSISFADGFAGPRGDVGFMMVYSQEKVQSIISDLLGEGLEINWALAGLDGDFTENSCMVFDGKDFLEYVSHPRSQWAAPILIVSFYDRPARTYEVWEREEHLKNGTANSL